MRRLFAKALTIILISVSLYSCGSNISAEDYVDVAIEAFSKNDYTLTIAACEEALKLDKKNPIAYFYRGLSNYALFEAADSDNYLDQDEYYEALESFYDNCISDCSNAIKLADQILDEDDRQYLLETSYYFMGDIMYDAGDEDYAIYLKKGGEDGLERLREIEQHEASVMNQTDRNAFDDYSSQGSGFIIDPAGFIATNNHVIEGVDDDDIEVWFDWTGDRRSYEAKVVVTDPENDLAILRITSKRFREMDPLPYIISEEQALTGTEVFTLGYPDIFSLGGEIKMTKGVISSTSGFHGDRREYQIDANIHGGNSGGPLFDENGRLIGINSSSFTQDANIHYSIKSSMLLDLIKENRLDMDIPETSGLDTLSLPQKVKSISPYVVLITNK